MVKVRPASSSIFVEVGFRRPIFEWQGVPARFFEMLHSALSSQFAMSPRDFTVTPGNSLSDVAARYNILGGASSVALSADKVLFEFRNLRPADYQLVLRILQAVDEKFGLAFPENEYSRIHSNSFDHVEFADNTSADDYLTRYKIAPVETAFSQIGVAYHAAGRFGVTATDGSWFAVCTVEKSEVAANGLFIHFDITLSQIQKSDPFEAKLERARRVSLACMAALGLEWVNAE